MLVICLGAISLWGNPIPHVQGQFKEVQNEEGTFNVEFTGKDFTLKSSFPGKPILSGQTANYIMQNPLVQMSILIAGHENKSPEEIVKMMMSIIGKEYSNMNFKITDAKKTDLKQDDITGGTKSTEQYTIDLDNGFREFTTFNIYQNKGYDIVVMSRFILSSQDKDNTAMQTKGKDIASDFLKKTTVEFKK